MKAELEKRYIPSTYFQDLSERIASFSQGHLFVAEYFDEFHTLSSRAKVDAPDYISVGRYKRGFHKLIRDIMLLSTINTMLEAGIT